MANYAARNANWQQQNANNQALWGGILGAAGTIAGGPIGGILGQRWWG